MAIPLAGVAVSLYAQQGGPAIPCSIVGDSSPGTVTCQVSAAALGGFVPGPQGFGLVSLQRSFQSLQLDSNALPLRFSPPLLLGLGTSFVSVLWLAAI